MLFAELGFLELIDWSNSSLYYQKPGLPDSMALDLYFKGTHVNDWAQNTENV